MKIIKNREERINKLSEKIPKEYFPMKNKQKREYRSKMKVSDLHI